MVCLPKGVAQIPNLKNWELIEILRYCSKILKNANLGKKSFESQAKGYFVRNDIVSWLLSFSESDILLDCNLQELAVFILPFLI